MKKTIILFFLGIFGLSSCGTPKKNCNGDKKIKSEMW